MVEASARQCFRGMCNSLSQSVYPLFFDACLSSPHTLQWGDLMSEGHAFIVGREIQTYSVNFSIPSRLTSHAFADSHSPHKHAPQISISPTHTHTQDTCVHTSPCIFASCIQK